MTDAELTLRLGAPVRRRFGADAQLVGLQVLQGGHAGLTYRLDVQMHDGSTVPMVLKRAPEGVGPGGACDLFRQAALLNKLSAANFPSPRILWADPGTDEVRVPYVVMEWVDGREHFPLVSSDAGGSSIGAGDDSILLPETLWHGAVDVLVDLCKFDWREVVGAMQTPLPLSQELDRWEATLMKSPDPHWIGLGLRARDALARKAPIDGRVSLSHGDFQPSNLLVKNGRIVSIIDWDLFSIGDALLDIGWLMMWADRSYWGPHWEVRCPLSVDDLASRYASATGCDPLNLRWYHAFAGYRFGAITCLNVRLHRSGRRVDPVWDKFAQDVVRLFARSSELADSI